MIIYSFLSFTNKHKSKIFVTYWKQHSFAYIHVLSIQILHFHSQGLTENVLFISQIKSLYFLHYNPEIKIEGPIYYSLEVVTDLFPVHQP